MLKLRKKRFWLEWSAAPQKYVLNEEHLLMILPTGWESISLQECVYFQEGPGLRKWQFGESGVPFLNIRTFNKGRIDKTKCQFVKLEEFTGKYEHFLLEAGDIVVSSSGTLGKLVVIKEQDLPLMLNTSVIRYRSLYPEHLSQSFLKYYLQSEHFFRQIDTSKTGTAILNYGPSHLKQMKMLVPPASEQRRIVVKLEELFVKLDACRERLEQVPRLLKQFRQSVLAAAFTGKLTAKFRETHKLTAVSESLARIKVPPRPNRFASRTNTIIDGNYALAVNNPQRELPRGWKWTPLVDIARMESGHTPSRSHPEYWVGDVPWIGIADARDGHGKTISTTYQHTNQMGLDNSAARMLPAGTVCLSRTASVGYVTRMGVPMATSQDFANWTCTSAIDPDWLKFLFVAETDAIYRFGEGSTHTTVYFPELLAFHVALPPIEEQQEIVCRIEALFKIADTVEDHYLKAHEQLDKLPQSILARAFRGELVPQDPDDEPASAILERIRAERLRTAKTAVKAKRQATPRTKKKPIGSLPFGEAR